MKSFKPGGKYNVEVPTYMTDGTPVNNWIHASAGVMEPADPATHQQAKVCTQAAFSVDVAASHMYVWTAPATGKGVTLSAAMADSKTTAYQTNTVRPCHIPLCVDTVLCVTCWHALPLNT